MPSASPLPRSAAICDCGSASRALGATTAVLKAGSFLSLLFGWITLVTALSGFSGTEIWTNGGTYFAVGMVSMLIPLWSQEIDCMFYTTRASFCGGLAVLTVLLSVIGLVAWITGHHLGVPFLMEWSGQGPSGT